jgi:hypothetical protein
MRNCSRSSNAHRRAAIVDHLVPRRQHLAPGDFATRHAQCRGRDDLQVEGRALADIVDLAQQPFRRAEHFGQRAEAFQQHFCASLGIGARNGPQ